MCEASRHQLADALKIAAVIMHIIFSISVHGVSWKDTEKLPVEKQGGM